LVPAQVLLVATSACVTALRRLSEVAPDAALDAEAPGGVMALAKEVLRKHADRADDAALTQPPVWNSTTGLGGPDQTSELSISVKSKSIRLIFGRIDCSRRVLEAQPKSLCQNGRIRSH